MRLQHTHEADGPVKVTVSAPNLPVFIAIDGQATHCKVDVVTDGHNGAIWAGPNGFLGSGLGVEVGSLGMLASLRSGSFVSGGGTVTAGGRGSVVSGGGQGGSVRATGRGSIACGGNIENVATGDGARIVGGKSDPTPEPGVYLTVPEGCVFTLKRFSDLDIRKGEDVASSIDEAVGLGWLEVKR